MHTIRILTLLTLFVAAPHSVANEGDAAIRAALESYKNALNSGDANNVIDVFSDDVVLMRTNNMPLVGKEAAKKAYRANFANVKIEADFDIQEVLQFSSDYAMLRTIGTGKATILKTGMTVQGKNNEIFVLKKQDDGVWKIARYIFSPAMPVPAPPKPPAQ